MKIGLLVLSIGSFGNKGYYNLQEIGLAKALQAYADNVYVYKLIDKKNNLSIDKIGKKNKIKIMYIPAYKVGTNGIVDCKYLDKSIDALICFSDTQLFFSQVYKWSLKNNVMLFPYIGVVKSHSNNGIKKIIVDMLNHRNISIYKKSICFAKTPMVMEELISNRIANVYLAPVGLDLQLLNDNEKVNDKELRERFGFAENDKIILFIGRMIEEKKPNKMIELFNKIIKIDSKYKLIMVGEGPLKNIVKNKIIELGIENYVKLIDRVSNNEMWKIYSVADTLINLNEHEIYGMVLLEAMFYNCRVIAYRAPGPSYIIKDSINGYLVENDENIINKLLDETKFETRQYIKNNFSWNSTASVIYDVISSCIR